MSTNKYSKSDLQKVTLFSTLLFTKEEIELALLADDQIVDFEQAQKRGLINEQYETRKALFNEAKSGNVSALKEWMQLKENIKTNEKRKNRK